MKNWLRKKLLNFIHNEPQYAVAGQNIAVVDDTPDIDGLRFTVMSANGGIIVQLRQYDRKTDRNNHATYIITDDEPVAERIGQIVSMELLRS